MSKVIKLPFNDNSVISVGWTGQNEYEEVTFDISAWLKKFPTGVVRVFYKLNTDGKLYPIADFTSDTYIWKPQAADFPKPGRYSAQAIMESETTIGKSDIFYFDIKKSLDHLNQISDDPPPEYPPSYIQKIMQDMEALAQRAESAAEHIPYYEDGKLYVWDEDTQQFVEFSLDIDDAVEKYFDKHPITITETDPTVPEWAKQPEKPTYTAQEVGALPADTPIPAEVTEQTVARWGFTKNTGTYSKPSGGIPKTDLAPDVQTSLGKADTALQEHQSLSGYATEQWVEGKGYLTQHQDISGKADKIPRIAKASTDTTAEIEPNKLYVFPEMASLAITLSAITDASIVNEYHFCFDSGATATVLTLPASVLQPDGFTVEANMHYEVSILEGAMTAQGWAVSSS